MRFSRAKAGTLFLIGSLALTLGALMYPTIGGIQYTATTQDRIIANTGYGPMTEADRDFVVKVRAAGLWEHPLGQLAMQRGTTKKMKEAGEHLVAGHTLLDDSCRKVASALNITLPNEASPQQQQFVATVESKQGTEFDSTAVDIMRVTHGQIYPAIAKIRASTENSLVRQLANQANEVVLDHMTSLENTGMVNHEQNRQQVTAPPNLPDDQLTPPPPPPGSPIRKLTKPQGLGDDFYRTSVVLQ
ncbi:DUF4142 domain-containing protein [Streptomyces sp. NPDC047108]|uniref:DUF4142 domain-containing protein n=1 Tax=Streptomyces sp. NPDC047108 TaxID=3155025 RepID=UPI0033F6D36A